MAKVIEIVEFLGAAVDGAEDGAKISEADGSATNTYHFLIGVMNYWDAKRLDREVAQTRTFDQTATVLEAMQAVRAAKKAGTSIKIEADAYKLIEPMIKEYAMRAYGMHGVPVVAAYTKAVKDS